MMAVDVDDVEDFHMVRAIIVAYTKALGHAVMEREVILLCWPTLHLHPNQAPRPRGSVLHPSGGET